MLIDKFVKEGETVSLKLVSGEEIIARFEEETSEHIKVSKPLALVQGGSSLGMIPWFFLADSSTVKISKHAIVAGPVVSKKEAASQYIQGTTGIALS